MKAPESQGLKRALWPKSDGARGNGENCTKGNYMTTTVRRVILLW